MGERERVVTKFRNWFVLSARDLRLQTLSVTEIADAMLPVAEASMSVPVSFARRVRQVLEDEGSLEPQAAPAVRGAQNTCVVRAE